MDLTRFLARILGPVLVLRGASIAIDRPHFVEMLGKLDHEASTISFSMFPIILFMSFMALAHAPVDTSRTPGLLMRLVAWGGMLKTALLILFPALVVSKAQVLGRAGFLDVVLLATCAVGAYFTWVGFFASTDRAQPLRTASS